jgi:hypothetical protein
MVDTKRIPIKRIITTSLIIGLLLGAMVSYFMFPRIITKVENETRVKVLRDTVFVEQQKIVYRTKYITLKEQSTGTDSSLNESPDRDSLNVPDSAEIAAVPDSIPVDEPPEHAQMPENNGDGDIVIAQNELLETRNIIPDGDPGNFYCQSRLNLDSLLVDNYTTQAKEEGIKVEFWRSPINVVGYQLDKNKLILFGFYEFDQVGLRYNDDGSIQMSYLDNEYKLECGYDFRPLIINKK